MSKIRKVKNAIHSTPVIGTFYDIAWTVKDYFKWRRLCRDGRRYMTDSGSTKFDYSNPLKIEGLKVVEIRPGPLDNLFQNNPTICLEKDRLRIYWRITNWRDNPEVNHWGRRKLRKALTDPILLSRTGTGFLRVYDGVISEDLKDEGVISELDSMIFQADRDHAKAALAFAVNVTYEDPKVLVSEPSLLALTAVEQGNIGAALVTKAVVALFDLNTKKIVPLNSPRQNAREKNWVLAKSSSNSVTLLRQSEPHYVVEVDRYSGELLKEDIRPGNGRAFLHGGSGFVLVDNSYYLRVARHRISLSGVRNIHVSHIVKHDLELNEISRSKPFVFRKYAFEICNGFDYDGNYFYFSWGENDEKIFVGSTTKTELLHWLQANESKIR